MSNDATHSHLWPGVPLALASAALFGAATPLSKLLLGVTDPWVLAGILYLGAGLGLGAFQAGRRILRVPSVEAPIRRQEIPLLALVVFFGGVLGPVLLMFGLSMTSAAAGSLLLNLEGLATMGIAWVVFREYVDRRLLLGALAILAGAALLSWNGRAVRFDLGGLLIAAACLSWAIDNNLTRRLSATDPVQIATIKGLVAGAVNLALALIAGAALPSLSVVLAGGLVGIFSIGVSLVMFLLGLRYLGTARTGAYFSLAPFVGALLALIMLPEPVTPTLVVAGILMGLGLLAHLSERHEHGHDHEALEHEHRHVHDEHHRHAHEDPVTEPHSHRHRHEPMRHTHPHYPDLHHRHGHS